MTRQRYQSHGMHIQANAKVIRIKKMKAHRNKGMSNAQIAHRMGVNVSQVFRDIGKRGKDHPVMADILKAGDTASIIKGEHAGKTAEIIRVTGQCENKLPYYVFPFGEVLARWCK